MNFKLKRCSEVMRKFNSQNLQITTKCFFDILTFLFTDLFQSPKLGTSIWSGFMGRRKNENENE